MDTTIQELTSLTEGTLLRGAPDTAVRGFGSLDKATADQISFFGNRAYVEQLRKTGAGAVLVADPEVEAPDGVALIQVENPVVAFDKILRKFGTPSPEFVPGIAEAAFVDPSVVLDQSKVSVLPNASVLKNATIGEGTRIGAGTVIGEDCTIGKDCEIGANVSIREGCIIGDRVIIHSGVVIGADGFGFELADGRHQKIEQLGIVRIDSDVEIGANTTIDRARFGETVIGEGTKIDNLVQVGHNAVIGKHCIIVAQTGISGSATIGDYVVFGAQSGVAGHITIASQNQFAGRSGVISSVTEPGQTWFGYPAKLLKESRKENMRLKQLPNLMKRVKTIEEKLEKND